MILLRLITNIWERILSGLRQDFTKLFKDNLFFSRLKTIVQIGVRRTLCIFFFFFYYTPIHTHTHTGTGKSSGTFDIPIRFLLRPNLNAGMYVDCTTSLMIDSTATLGPVGNLTYSIDFDQATSNGLRFRVAIPDKFDYQDNSSEVSSDSPMEEEE